MQYKAQRPIREVSNFLIHQVKKSTRQTHLDILREMLDWALLQVYTGQETLAHEYSRVDLELRMREKELHSVDMIIQTMETN